MKCEDRDQNIVLRSLGELSFPQQLRLDFHLVLCKRCRLHQMEMKNVSGMMAQSMKAPATPFPVKIQRPAYRLSRLSPAGSVMLAAAAMAWFLSIGAVVVVRTIYQPQHIQRDDGCRPDLPNDKCR